jgi:hypothetical protein
MCKIVIIIKHNKKNNEKSRQHINKDTDGKIHLSLA